MTTLLLARHGQTDWNLEHRWQGDPPLNDAGRAQAEALAASLDATPLDGLYSSNLRRALETAEVVAKRIGLEVQVDARLREIDVGDWVGFTTAELERRFPAGFERFREGHAGWEQGENYDQMVARVTAAFFDIAAAHPGDRILVVAHGGVMCAAWLASGRPLADWPGTRNSDLHEISIDGGAIRWVRVVERAGERDDGKPSLFWRV
jgi:broad specificity phosphatase PhoE